MRNFTIRILLLKVILFIALAQTTSAQNTILVGLNGGLSVPSGEYAGTTLNKDGFAQLGVSFGADVVWFFSKHIGVAAAINQSNNPIDVTTLTTERLKADPFLQELSIRSESFTNTTITAGIYGRWTFGDNFSFYGKLMAGWIRSQTPYQLYRTSYFQLGPTYYEITSSLDDAFVVIPGIGGMYLFKRGLGVKFDIDYTGRTMTFPFQTSSGMRYDERQVHYTQIMLGVVVSF